MESNDRIPRSAKEQDRLQRISKDTGRYLDEVLKRNEREIREKRSHFGYTNNQKRPKK